MKIMGIDLAGLENNPSGICILDNYKVDLRTLYTDKEIIILVKKVNPSLITIDAPLSLPQGRCCLEENCECAVGGHFRQAEQDIRSYGRVLPLTFHGMKALTMRGVSLAPKLQEKYQLKETHPHTAQKILELENIKEDLGQYFHIPPNPTEHELDALIAALTGYFYLNDCYIELGDPIEGTIILPALKECLSKLKNFRKIKEF